MVPEPISIDSLRCCVCGNTTEIMLYDPGRAEERDPKLFLILRGRPPRARCLECWPIISMAKPGETRQNPAYGQGSKT